MGPVAGSFTLSWRVDKIAKAYTMMTNARMCECAGAGKTALKLAYWRDPP